MSEYKTPSAHARWIDIRSDDNADLLPALQTALDEHGKHPSKVHGFFVDGPRLRVLSSDYRHKDKEGYSKLPAELNAGGILPIVAAHLNAVPRSDLNSYVDTDGSVELGFRVSSGDSWPISCVVEPCWCAYHK